MTLEEKRAWIRLVVSVGAYAAYVAIVLSRLNDHGVDDVGYAAPLLWSVGAAIAGAIVAEIVIGMVTPKASRAKDVRDREIGQFGDYVGQSFVAIGGVSAMLMALAEWDWFWIANVIYLCFVLSTLLGSTTKVILYRKGVPQW